MVPTDGCSALSTIFARKITTQQTEAASEIPRIFMLDWGFLKEIFELSWGKVCVKYFPFSVSALHYLKLARAF